ncbi:MAG: hypothetical protein GIW95_10635 [Candidatus Eremiobacteraeota bacterium]|nr:hypothetical protein [Candidatus Eremiobacteraeota bacterium]
MQLPIRRLFLPVTFAVAAIALLPGCSHSGGMVPAASSGAFAPNALERAPQSISGLQVVDAVSGATWPGPLTLTWPQGPPQGGDLEIACVQNQAHVLANVPSGWKALYNSAAGSFGTALFYTYNSYQGSASETFTLPVAGNISVAMVKVRGRSEMHRSFRTPYSARIRTSRPRRSLRR